MLLDLVVIAVSMLLLLGVAGLSSAQDAKPWEQPGMNVGEEITGPDEGKMVWVPAGKFTMGSPAGKGGSNEVLAHRVRITKGFWLGKCAVTLGQWKAYCQAVGIGMGEARAPGDNHPVVCVNWDDVTAYCRYYGMVLPKEAQWEYAARGPKGHVYPWGNEWDANKCCNPANLGPEGDTFPVGSFSEGASWCGALNMAGNVWEWCWDKYDEGYHTGSHPFDLRGAACDECRVLRGGSWINDASGCRSANRNLSDPSNRDSSHGFRCARTP